ncbi:cobyrinic acid a,c-diamide synthase [Saccharothrix tamanrassetensis]|uniref:Hydrogenobyrinate a,c-diamide synthase n=1 Tax=Saccharothrix tamanrassetensis TaxID=1051531 RepID=A0A841CIY5_9PSEU|nr:cobyrinate a,c-diamide synthase [Saccharothrix tamanrassetensis]MBB5955616.1 cobyrinic acid a,c-diamide synthase [Saccharothrix tamanrassetensis]
MSRLVVAAPASGSGKTTVATGLMAALRRAGDRVAPFKVGPDYIDPGYHGLATGRPGRNLDPVMVGEHRVASLFAHGARGCDLAVVEGVMGLFDGRVDTEGIGSTAHVAKLLSAPVLFVVDARGQSRSLAALLHGFRGYDPTVRLGGVVLNQVGSARHEHVLRGACAEVGLEVLGVLPRDDEFALPSRHLGLVTAAEHGRPALDAVDAIASAVARHVDLDAVRRLAAEVPAMAVATWDPAAEVSPVAGSPVVAVAGGAAFTFGYAEHVELLRAAGADVVVVDPLRDQDLPEGTAGLVLPGGFPEQHAAELSANAGLRTAVAAFARSGAPVHAECGGLLYLARSLDGVPMCGVIDAEGSMTPRLTLGYRDAVAPVDSVLARAGTRITGHEFHRTTLSVPSGARPAWQWRGHDQRPVAEGFVLDGVHASYLHTHPVSAPESVTRFVRACATESVRYEATR